jgi:hypothetical protein
VCTRSLDSLADPLLPVGQEGLMRQMAFFLVLAAAGCTSDNTSNMMMMNGCRCTNAVPGGTLDIPCGASGCLGSTGYRCLDKDRYEENPNICGFDLSVPLDFSGLTGIDLSIPRDLYGVDLAASLGCNGVELCASRCTNSTCVMDCYNRVTNAGSMLDNNFFACQVNFCSTVHTAVDAGFSCNAADVAILNGSGMGTISMACSQCLGNYGFTGLWSTYCASQIAACRADLP